MDALLDQNKGQKQEGGANIWLEVFSLILERYISEVLVLFVTSQIADFTQLTPQLCVLAKRGASKKVRDGFSPLNFA